MFEYFIPFMIDIFWVNFVPILKLFLCIFDSFCFISILIAEKMSHDDFFKQLFANNIFEEDLNLTIERYSALFGPVLILIIGAFVGSIVLSIMIPLFNLSSGGL